MKWLLSSCRTKKVVLIKTCHRQNTETNKTKKKTDAWKDGQKQCGEKTAKEEYCIKNNVTKLTNGQRHM